MLCLALAQLKVQPDPLWLRLLWARLVTLYQQGHLTQQQLMKLRASWQWLANRTAGREKQSGSA